MSGQKRKVLRVGGAVLAACLLVLGVAYGLTERVTSEDLLLVGTQAVTSRDGTLLYALDAEAGSMLVLDAKELHEVAKVGVGKVPSRIALSPDDQTLFVSNRGGRSVSVVQRATWREEARIEVGVEPTGMTVSDDGRLLYVLTADPLEGQETGGQLNAVDVKARTVVWSVSLDEEPKDISLLGGGKALVRFQRKPRVAVVDLERRQVVSMPRPERSARAGGARTSPGPDSLEPPRDRSRWTAEAGAGE